MHRALGAWLPFRNFKNQSGLGAWDLKFETEEAPFRSLNFKNQSGTSGYQPSSKNRILILRHQSYVRMAADPSRRRPEHHPAVSDVLSTLTEARGTLADVQRRLDLEFREAYPDHVSILVTLLRNRSFPFLADGIRRRRLQANPAKLVARVKRVVEQAAALKEMSRDLLTQKQVASFPTPRFSLFTNPRLICCRC
jgi:hypothetical protein